MYENMVADSAEILSVFSDMDGGLWALAILSELLQEMCSAENWQAAETVRREMYQAAEVESSSGRIDHDALKRFSEIIIEGVEDAL